MRKEGRKRGQKVEREGIGQKAEREVRDKMGGGGRGRDGERV